MSITKEKTQKIIQDIGGSNLNSGSTEVQVAIFTDRIKTLTEHFKIHKKDNHSRYGLLKLVSKRRKALDYLKKRNEEGYKALIKKLGLRR